MSHYINFKHLYTDPQPKGLIKLSISNEDRNFPSGAVYEFFKIAATNVPGKFRYTLRNITDSPRMAYNSYFSFNAKAGMYTFTFGILKSVFDTRHWATFEEIGEIKYYPLP